MRTPGQLFRLPTGAMALATVAALAGGCASNPQVAHGPATAAAVEEPLEVWLPGSHSMDRGPWALFYLSKPAYVAIFEVRPGVGVQAVYPYDRQPTAQRRFHAGINTVLRREGPPGFRTDGLTRMGSTQATHQCLWDIQSPVVYRLVVASERPLELQRLRHDVSFFMRPALGSVHFASGSAYSTMENLLQAVLPVGATADPMGGPVEWAADYVAYWISSESCAVRFAAAPFSPIERLGSGIHRVRAHPPIEEPPAEEEPTEEKPDVVAERPDIPTEVPGDPKPPIRDRTDGDGERIDAPRDRQGLEVPVTTWGPEERRDRVLEPDSRRGSVGSVEARGWAPEGRRADRSFRDSGARAEGEALLRARTNPRSFDELRVREGRRAAAARPDRPRFLPNAHSAGIRSRSARPTTLPLPGAREGAGVRSGAVPRSADRPAPRVRTPRPAPVRSAPRPVKSSSDSGRSKEDAQK